MKNIIMVVIVTVMLAIGGSANAGDLLGWYNDLSHVQQESRLQALENTKALTYGATDDNFGKYLKRWMSRKTDDGKNVSCLTGADALMTELKADPIIASEFSMDLYNTGVNVYGRSIPIPHFTIRLDPINGIGPSYIADRYLGGDLAQILDWDEADLTDYVIEVYVRTYPIADSDFDRMATMMKPEPIPEPDRNPCWWEHPDFIDGCYDGQFTCNQQNCYNYEVTQCPGGLVAVGRSGECPSNPDVRVSG